MAILPGHSSAPLPPPKGPSSAAGSRVRLAAGVLLVAFAGAWAPPGEELLDQAYRSGDPDAYAAERCTLDLYLPAGAKDFPTLVWFHGGGLESGSKSGARKMARSLTGEGVAVAAVNYRLSPKVSYPAYLEDAAAAAAWVRRHVAEHGGDPKRVFISGHSAGGYLTLMLALAPKLLEKEKATPADFAGYIPVSGQAVTHSTVRKERGLARETIVVDDAAPLYHVRKDAPPILILAADKDMAGRVEENRLLLANLNATGCRTGSMIVIPDRTHGTVGSRIAEPGDPARSALLKFMGATKD